MQFARSVGMMKLALQPNNKRLTIASDPTRTLRTLGGSNQKMATPLGLANLSGVSDLEW